MHHKTVISSFRSDQFHFPCHEAEVAAGEEEAAALRSLLFYYYLPIAQQCNPQNVPFRAIHCDVKGPFHWL